MIGRVPAEGVVVAGEDLVLVASVLRRYAREHGHQHPARAQRLEELRDEFVGAAMAAQPAAPTGPGLPCAEGSGLRQEEIVAPSAGMTAEPLIDAGEAAGILGVSPRRVGQLARAGQLGARKVADRWAFPRSEVEAFAATRKDRTT